jgi:hypothetical protein
MRFSLRNSRNTVTVLAVGALALTLAACGSQTSAGSTTQNPAPTAQIEQLNGMSTTVDLDPTTAAVLQQNHVSVAPVAPATASAQSGATAVSFPITDGYVALYPQNDLPFVRGLLTHSGGLTFSVGDKSLTATDFIVDPGTSTLMATVNGQQVPLLDLNGSKVQVTKDSQGQVHLDGTVAMLSAPAAQALNQTFGVSLFKEGIPLGVVHIIARSA